VRWVRKNGIEVLVNYLKNCPIVVVVVVVVIIIIIIIIALPLRTRSSGPFRIIIKFWIFETF
jgi:hypothetical protein